VPGEHAQSVADTLMRCGVRAILNYGHTLGHAIESLSITQKRGATRLHHGEAISVGMVFAAVVSRSLGYIGEDLVDEHRDVLSSVGLPTTVEGVGWSEVRERMKVDKKYGGGDRLVLLEAKGKPIVERVPQKVLSKAFAEVAS
jgi:3-dehydroquinate synthetase